MVCCVAIGCAIQPGMGRMMHRFPRDPLRRQEWQEKVKRVNWQPHNNSYLCSDHFDESQYENGRADGLKRLKPYAVPTLFVFAQEPKAGKPPKKRQAEWTAAQDPSAKRGVKQPLAEHTYSRSGIQGSDGDHQNQHLSNDENSDLEDNKPDIDGDTPAGGGDASASGGDATAGDGDTKAGDGDNTAGVGDTQTGDGDTPAGSSSGTTFAPQLTPRATASAKDPLADLREAAMARTIRCLKQQLAKERKEKYKLKEENRSIARQLSVLGSKMSKVFNKDQLDRLSRNSTRGLKWSDETIKKALQLRFACGCAGYDYLLQQHLPLPSQRSLRRSLQGTSVEPDMVEDLLQFVRKRGPPTKMEETVVLHIG